MNQMLIDLACMQVSQLYGIDSPVFVYAHQLWAACSMYQATGKLVYWNTVMDIYTKWQKQTVVGIGQLYQPVPNYDNPLYYGLMCMAQSSPSATGIEGKFDVELKGLNQEDLLSQPPVSGTRLEVLEQLWKTLVSQWINGTTLAIGCALLTSPAAHRNPLLASNCLQPFVLLTSYFTCLVLAPSPRAAILLLLLMVPELLCDAQFRTLVLGLFFTLCCGVVPNRGAVSLSGLV
jgi:hypothetical protein